jgi:hypothetical protein
MNALAEAQPQRCATVVTGRSSASSSTAWCRRSWVRHCGKVMPTVSVGGMAGPLIGTLADATSLQTALTPLIALPAVAGLLFRLLAEPAGVTRTRGAVSN